MTDTPKRRWLRFNLRTMFVALTFVPVWLWWNADFVRQPSVEPAQLQPLPPSSTLTPETEQQAIHEAIREAIEKAKRENSH